MGISGIEIDRQLIVLVVFGVVDYPHAAWMMAHFLNKTQTAIGLYVWYGEEWFLFLIMCNFW